MIIIIGLLFFNGVKWILFNGGYYVIFGWEMVNVIKNIILFLLK
jgi:hypothetical protein